MRCRNLPCGTIIAFEYCKDGDNGWQPRIGVIERVRDLEEEPLSSVAIVKRPDLERSRWLYKIHDLARQETRSFYGCRMRGLRVLDLRPIVQMASRELQTSGS